MFRFYSPNFALDRGLITVVYVTVVDNTLLSLMYNIRYLLKERVYPLGGTVMF